MKHTLYFLSILLISCTTQNEQQNLTTTEESSASPEPETAYDSTLAKQYGADQYGMKPYVMAFLKTGPTPPKDSAHAVELQNAHMANINRLAEEGKLVLAGPFYGDQQGAFRGIYIFNTSSLDSARTYTASDPAIQYGSLKMELINWYGSAAVMGINQVHNKIAKVNI